MSSMQLNGRSVHQLLHNAYGTDRHNGEVTCLSGCFYENNILDVNMFFSGGSDGVVKRWRLNCMNARTSLQKAGTVETTRCENLYFHSPGNTILSIGYYRKPKLRREFLFTGATDGNLAVWMAYYPAQDTGGEETEEDVLDFEKSCLQYPTFRMLHRISLINVSTMSPSVLDLSAKLDRKFQIQRERLSSISKTLRKSESIPWVTAFLELRDTLLIGDSYGHLTQIRIHTKATTQQPQPAAQQQKMMSIRKANTTTTAEYAFKIEETLKVHTLTLRQIVPLPTPVSSSSCVVATLGNDSCVKCIRCAREGGMEIILSCNLFTSVSSMTIGNHKATSQNNNKPATTTVPHSLIYHEKVNHHHYK